MYIKGIGRIKNLIKSIKVKFSNKAIILAYHRIFNPETDPQLLCVTPENFEDQLKVITTYFNPISLQSLHDAIKNKKIPNNAIVLTFDDGYVDNLLYAKPLLEKYNVPATIFVTTHYINNNEEPWWDKLENIILLTKTLPPELSLTISQKNFYWQIKNQTYTKTWTALQQPPNDRFKLYLELHHLMKPLTIQEQNLIFKQLNDWVQITNQSRENYRIVNQKELIALSNSTCIELGSHTITHPQLSTQQEHNQLNEIIESKRQLMLLTQKPITSFSYPYGSRNDISENLPLLLQKHYHYAVANFPGFITKHDVNLFLLPRQIVRNWNKQVFHKSLRAWFHEY